jgi:hypothetical protein
MVKSKTLKGKKSKTNSKTKKNMASSYQELCKKKYENKTVRGTPKNWAYKKCLQRKDWDRCKSLPPSGWNNMYRYFCE